MGVRESVFSELQPSFSLRNFRHGVILFRCFHSAHETTTMDNRRKSGRQRHGANAETETCGGTL
jgi:hypothetical protein